MKEIITSNEIEFLLVTAASEDSVLIEINQEFEKWSCNQTDVLIVLSNLIQSGYILVSKLNGSEFKDLSVKSSLEFTQDRTKLDTNEFILFLTDTGEKYWNKEDFGITTKRAKYLMFSNQKTHQSK